MAKAEELHQKILPFFDHSTACLIIHSEMKEEDWNYYHQYYANSPIVHLYLVGVQFGGENKIQKINLDGFNFSKLESIYFYGHLYFQIKKKGLSPNLKSMYFNGDKPIKCLYKQFMPLDLRKNIKNLYLNNIVFRDLHNTFPNLERLILDHTIITDADRMVEQLMLAQCVQMKELNFIGRVDLFTENEQKCFDDMMRLDISIYPDFCQCIQTGQCVIRHYDYFCPTLEDSHLRWKIADEQQVLLDPNLPDETLEHMFFNLWLGH